jgi:ATPase subunit of ABC transporter with duplicated ATPase domains
MSLLPIKYRAPRFDGFLFEFGRINVILGANGSGKSRLLSELRDAVPGVLSGTKAVYIGWRSDPDAVTGGNPWGSGVLKET